MVFIVNIKSQSIVAFQRAHSRYPRVMSEVSRAAPAGRVGISLGRRQERCRPVLAQEDADRGPWSSSALSRFNCERGLNRDCEGTPPISLSHMPVSLTPLRAPQRGSTSLVVLTLSVHFFNWRKTHSMPALNQACDGKVWTRAGTPNPWVVV